MWRFVSGFFAFAIGFVAVRPASAEEGTYRSEVRVQGATRLDWVYPLIQESPAASPADLVRGYRSVAQSYELFEPAGMDGSACALVIFVSPQDRPVGWRFWEATCRRHGVLFAGLRDMGNGKPFAHRVRAVLDVLDDLRQRYRIDPDRTYLAGFSGGAQVVCATALHLPEYFGGVVCIGHSPRQPEAPWLLERVRQRLSLAIVCGEREPAATLVKVLDGPLWNGAGVRMEQAILPRRGHTMPEPRVLESAFQWLEDDLENRRVVAGKNPAWRIADAPSRADWAMRQFEDAEIAVGESRGPWSIDAALQQLAGLVKCWPDVPAAGDGKAVRDEYSSRVDRPWEKIRAAQDAKRIGIQAEGYTKLALDGGKSFRPQRAQFAKAAIFYWQQLVATNDGGEATAETRTKIAELEKIVAEAPPDAGLVPLDQLRFKMDGDVTLAEGIEDLRAALAPLGYELTMNEAAIRAAGVDLDKAYRPRMKAATFNDIKERFLRRAGLRVRRQGNVIELLPDEKN